MIGWDITVARIVLTPRVERRPRVQRHEHDARTEPRSLADVDLVLLPSQGETLARWTTGAGGLTWMRPLEGGPDLVTLAATGYPSLYLVRAAAVAQALGHGPVGSRDEQLRVASTEAAPSDWWLLEAWDLS